MKKVPSYDGSTGKRFSKYKQEILWEGTSFVIVISSMVKKNLSVEWSAIQREAASRLGMTY